MHSIWNSIFASKDSIGCALALDALQLMTKSGKSLEIVSANECSVRLNVIISKFSDSFDIKWVPINPFPPSTKTFSFFFTHPLPSLKSKNLVELKSVDS
jgi:hypothetical protein